MITSDLGALVSDPATWPALVSLVVMEIALGIDNLIFLSLLTGRLPVRQQRWAQAIGLSLALMIRLLGLGAASFVARLTVPVIWAFGYGFSWRDMLLLAGGLFLIWKATTDIRQRIDPDRQVTPVASTRRSGFVLVVLQIPMLDLVLSLDSIITAVGMTDHLPIMIAAVAIAMMIMVIAAAPLSRFLQAYPSLIILALGFLLLIGVTLVAEAFGTYLPRGYIYSAMAFSAFIVGLDLLSRRAQRLRSEQANVRASAGDGPAGKRSAAEHPRATTTPQAREDDRLSKRVR